MPVYRLQSLPSPELVGIFRRYTEGKRLFDAELQYFSGIHYPTGIQSGLDGTHCRKLG